MSRTVWSVIYVVAMVAVVVSVDRLFFQDRFWLRLLVNVGVVTSFAFVYMRFLKGRA